MTLSDLFKTYYPYKYLGPYWSSGEVRSSNISDVKPYNSLDEAARLHDALYYLADGNVSKQKAADYLFAKQNFGKGFFQTLIGTIPFAVHNATSFYNSAGGKPTSFNPYILANSDFSDVQAATDLIHSMDNPDPTRKGHRRIVPVDNPTVNTYDPSLNSIAPSMATPTTYNPYKSNSGPGMVAGLDLKKAAGGRQAYGIGSCYQGGDFYSAIGFGKQRSRRNRVYCE